MHSNALRLEGELSTLLHLAEARMNGAEDRADWEAVARVLAEATKKAKAIAKLQTV